VKSESRVCPFCQEVVPPRRMRAHLDRYHAGQTPDSEKAKPKHATRRRPSGTKPKPAQGARARSGKLPPPREPLQLISRRATRVPGKRQCTNCHKQVMETYRYAKSNWGVAYLCRGCHVAVHPGYMGMLVIRPMQGGDFRPR